MKSTKVRMNRKAMVSGITKYERKLVVASYKPQHLATNYQHVGRWKMKTMANDNWYRDKEQGQEQKDGLGPEKMKRLQIPDSI
jgi:hypothetical protein